MCSSFWPTHHASTSTYSSIRPYWRSLPMELSRSCCLFCSWVWRASSRTDTHTVVLEGGQSLRNPRHGGRRLWLRDQEDPVAPRRAVLRLWAAHCTSFLRRRKIWLMPEVLRESELVGRQRDDRNGHVPCDPARNALSPVSWRAHGRIGTITVTPSRIAIARLRDESRNPEARARGTDSAHRLAARGRRLGRPCAARESRAVLL